MTKKVDVFCIGSPKAGSTWLFHLLKVHPQIFIPNEKEIHYFNRFIPESYNLANPNLAKGQSYLNKKFIEASNNQQCADFSTSYLYDETCAKRIAEYNNEAKIICIIRHPVDRAYSHYLFLMQRAFIKTVPFKEAIFERPDILSKGLYYKQLLPYYISFRNENIKIILFNDLISNPVKVIDSIEHFLKIEHIKVNNLSESSNKSKSVRFPWLSNRMVNYSNQNKVNNPFVNRLINKIITINTKPYKGNKSMVLKSLYPKYMSYFTEDIKSLSILIDTDLTHWIDNSSLDT